MEYWENEIVNEFFVDVFDVNVFGCDVQYFGFGMCWFQFFVLIKVSGKGDNFVVVFCLQLFQND